MSVGFHYHMRGLPDKRELKERLYDSYDDEESDKEWVRIGSEVLKSVIFSIRD